MKLRGMTLLVGLVLAAPLLAPDFVAGLIVGAVAVAVYAGLTRLTKE